MADYGLMKPHSQKAELQIRSNHCVHSLHVPQPKMEGGTSYSVVPSMGHQHHQLGVPWALLHPLGLPLKAAVFMLTHTSASPSAASWFFPGGTENAADAARALRRALTPGCASGFLLTCLLLSCLQVSALALSWMFSRSLLVCFTWPSRLFLCFLPFVSICLAL